MKKQTRNAKIRHELVAQGMDGGGTWNDLSSHWGETPEARYSALCADLHTDGLSWLGVRIIERIIIETPTGWTKMKTDKPVRSNNSGEALVPRKEKDHV